MRRLARVLRRIAIVLAGLCAVVLLGLAIVTQVPTLRARLARYGLGFVPPEIEISLGRIERLDPWALSAREVKITLRDHGVAADIARLDVHLNPWRLLRREVRLTQVDVQGATLRYDPSRAVRARPAAPAQPPAEGAARAWNVVVDEVRLNDLRARARWEGRPVWARVARCRASGAYGEVSRGRLWACALRAGRDRDVWLDLDVLEAEYDLAQGGRARLEGALAGAQLKLRARVPALDEARKTYPVDALELSLLELDQAALAMLGVEHGARLRTDVQLGVVAQRKGARLHFGVDAQAASATLRAAGVLSAGRVELSAFARADDLAAVSDLLPSLSVRGELSAVYAYAETPEWLIVDARDLHVDGRPIPDAHLRLLRRAQRITLQALRLTHGAGSLRGLGYYELGRAEGAAALTLENFSLAWLGPWLGARLSGRMSGTLSAARTARGTLDAVADLRLDALRYADVARARRVRLHVTANGPEDAPYVYAQAEVQRLRVAGQAVDAVAAHAAFDGARFEVQLAAEGRDAWGELLSVGELQGAAGIDASAAGHGELAGEPFTFTLRDLRYAGGALEVERLLLRSREAQLELRGGFDAQGYLHGDLALRDVALSRLSTFTGASDLRGELTLLAHLSGTLEAPAVEAEARLLRARWGGQPALDALARANLDAEARRADVHVRAWGLDGLELRWDAALAVPSAPRAWKRALWESEATLMLSLRAPLARLLAGYRGADMPPTTLDLAFFAEGRLRDPRAALYLTLETDDRSREHAEAQALWTPEQATLHVSLHDGRASLLRADAEAELPKDALRTLVTRGAAFRPSALRAHLELSERRLDRLRGVFGAMATRYGLALPVRTAARVDLRLADGAFQGEVDARARLFSHRLDADCDPRARTWLALEARVSGQDLQGALSGGTSEGGNFFANVFLRDALAYVLGEAGVAPGSIDARGLNLPLSQIPGLCQLGGGRAGFQLSGTLSHQAPPSMLFAVAVDRLRGGRGQPLSVWVQGGSDAGAAWVTARLLGEEKGRGSLEAFVPLRFDGFRPGIAMNEPVSARLRLSAVQLAPLLQFTDVLGRASGALSADVSLRGTLREPVPEGYVQFENAGFTIAALAQPIRRLKGRLRLSGRTLTIEDVSLRDGRGKLRLSGRAQLESTERAGLSLALATERFPLRRQGTVVAELTVDAQAHAQLKPDAHVALDVRIQDGNLWLTGGLGRAVQPLDVHPDLRFVDARAKNTGAAEEPGAGWVLERLSLNSERDLWLSHKDFSVQVGLELTLEGVEQGPPKLLGEARIVRGNLKLLGKSFNIQRGRVSFTGVYPPDPELDLTATFDPPGSGTALTVNVTGRASAPGLSFSGAADTPEEALAILSGMSAADAASSAQADARNFAMGVTAGLLSVTARRELGDWVPMITVGTDPRGQVSEARAGFDASALIPPFMEQFARGLYVEGIVGQKQQVTRGVGLGVRLELSLPRSVVTSVGFGPGTSWEADVFWIP